MCHVSKADSTHVKIISKYVGTSVSLLNMLAVLKLILLIISTFSVGLAYMGIGTIMVA